MNNFKRFLALALALVMVMALAACGGNDTTVSTQDTTPAESTSSEPVASSTTEEKNVTFRVQVVDEAGNPVVGAGVQLCLETCKIADTNEEGWAEFDNKVEDGYKANIAYLIDGTEVNGEPTYFESGVVEMTLTLTVSYRIKVVDAEGNPVAGETVTLVNEDTYAYNAAVTGEDGYAVFYNMVAEGYKACFGDHTDMKLDGVELTAFEGEAAEVTLTKTAE